jgi:integral membrane sensor domain MASE1
MILAMIAESGTPAAGVSAVTLSGILVTLGVFLKNRTPLNPDWIPLILVIIAIPVFIVWTWPVDFNGCVMAVGSALSAVGLYESTKSTAAAKKQGTLRAPEKSPNL